MTWWTPERLAVLEAEAVSWIGTPFAANSCSKGDGVSCAKLCGALYTAAGFEGIIVPDGQTAHARFNQASIITPFFDGNPYFAAVDPASRMAGDVLGFTVGKCVHHMGILLGGDRFIHSCDHVGVIVSDVKDATWLSRLSNVWRPKA